MSDNIEEISDKAVDVVTSNTVGILIIGFMLGVVGFWYLGSPGNTVEVEKRIIVEKLVPVEKIIEKIVIKEIEVPKIVEKIVIKTVPQTRIVYLPKKSNTIIVNDKERLCMALNIYRESNNQSIAGQIAVARVVMNRVKDRRYPSDPCGVIYDGPVRESWKTKKDPTLSKQERTFYPVKHRCQFSWYCDGKADEPTNTDSVAWKVADNIAYQILAFDKWNGIVEGATHYHADYVKPNWSNTLRLVTKIDDHIFYRRN